MKKKSTLWLLVADAGRAQVFALQGDRPVAVADESWRGPHKRSRDLVADKPGRAIDVGGLRRHAMEPHTDPVRVAERDFFARIARDLSAAARAGRFDRLVLAAPARALGDLRAALPKTVAARVTAEIRKDLTKATPAEIAAQVERAL
jgi:protein required for attachment to host cells